MNNFKNSIDKIEINEEDKKRILNNILQHKKKRFNINTFAYRFALFLAIFTIAIGSGYALIKAFKLDDKIAEYFELDEETKEQIEANGQDINIIKHYDNYDINYKQIIVGHNKIDIIFEMTNIKNGASLNNVIFTKGDIDENKIQINEYDENFKDVNYEDDDVNSYGFGTIENEENEENNNITYTANFSSKNNITSGKYTIRIYDSNLEYHDIQFNVETKGMKTINYNNKDILYNKDGITVTNDKMIITNSDIYIEATSEQLKDIENLDYDIMNFSTSYLILGEEGEEDSVKLAGKTFIKDDKIILYFEYFGDFINIDKVKAININDIKIKISD